MRRDPRLCGVVLLVGLATGCGPDATPPASTAPAPAAEDQPQTKEDAVAGAETKTVWNAYTVFEDGSEQLAGQLAVEGGVLSIVSAFDDENREYLGEIVARFNGKDELYEMVAPVGEERYTLKAKIVSRDDPDFERVLAAELRENEDLRVEPAE